MAIAMQGVIAVALLAAMSFTPRETAAQTRCEPTINNPCKPPPTPNVNANAQSEALKSRPTTRLDPVPVIPDIKLDRDTSMGFGQGGGIFGLERKF